MISLTVFGISALFLLILFFAKSRALLSGNGNFVLHGVSILDVPAAKLFSFLDFRWKQLSQTIRYIFLIVIPQRSEEAFRDMKGKAIEKYTKQKETLMGKREMLNNSSASFFLKKMREEKKNDKGGTIEDSLDM